MALIVDCASEVNGSVGHVDGSTSNKPDDIDWGTFKCFGTDGSVLTQEVIGYTDIADGLRITGPEGSQPTMYRRTNIFGGRGFTEWFKSY